MVTDYKSATTGVNMNLNTKTGQAGLINPKTGKSVDLRPMTKEEAAAAEKSKSK